MPLDPCLRTLPEVRAFELAEHDGVMDQLNVRMSSIEFSSERKQLSWPKPQGGTHPKGTCSKLSSHEVLSLGEREGTTMTPRTAPVETYVNHHDAIVRTMQNYLDAVREGKSDLMRPVFHPAATFFGHYPGGVMNGPVQPLFDWVDQNGPAPNIQARFAKLEVLGNIASVHLELEGLSGKLSGAGVSMSDVFTLMLTDDGWKIVQKAFHWHM